MAINGTSGADVLVATLQDTINGLGGDDDITGSEGDDIIYGSSGNDTIAGGGGNDVIWGGTSNDRISDGAGDDVVYAGEGDDRVTTGDGNDVFFGGKGFDTIDFSKSLTGVVVDMGKGTALGQGTDTLKDFEKLVGSSYADNIRGSSGDDVIEAGGGRNVIRGGAGSDDITGGLRTDTFVWSGTDVLDAAGNHRGVDTIRGYENNDVLDIRGLLKGVTYASLDEVVQFADVGGGTMLQVKLGGKFVDVALLADVQLGGPSATAYQGDGLILA